VAAEQFSGRRRCVSFVAVVIVAASLISGSPVSVLEPTPAAATEELPCSEGTYSTSGFEPCVDAPPGTFVDQPGQTAPTPCEPGTFQQFTASVSCEAAAPGHFVDAPGATDQQECPAGTYTDVEGRSTCDQAPPGTYVAQTGSTEPTPCPMGRYSSAEGATACTPASAGHYVGSPNSDQQTPCAEGSSSSGTGATACQPAPPGSYVPTDGATGATVCPAGRFSPDHGAVVCLSAPRGSFVGLTGQVKATLCPIGTFSGVEGATSCTPAPVRFFVPTIGAQSPTRCPPGTTTIVSGESSCIADQTAPVITSSTTGGTPGANGWFSAGPVIVTFVVDDPETPDIVGDGCGPRRVAGSTSATGTTFICSATSPGGTTSVPVTVRVDAQAPRLVITGNAGTYRVAAKVGIRCTAADDVSGVVSSRCGRINRPAWRLTPGRTTWSASATDRAGNTATASTSYRIIVTSRGLCRLTRRFVVRSGAFAAADRPTRRAVMGTVETACLTSTSKSDAFAAAVAGLVEGRYLAPVQAKAVARLAEAL
jgi:hypothetical protein